MRAYSQDLRERILLAVDQGRPRTEMVQLFGISLATLKRYIKQRREERPLISMSNRSWHPVSIPDRS
jgi:transposase